MNTRQIGALKKLEKQAPALEFELPDGTSVVKLGVIITLYFKKGYCVETKRKVDECFAHFYQSFQPHLKTMSYRQFKPLTGAAFKRSREQVLKTGPNEQFSWFLGSAATAQEANDYSLSMLNSFEFHGDKERSMLKMVLPWSLLKTSDGRETYKKWVLYLCNKLEAEHGYGGLSTVLPYEYHSYMPIEYELAQKFSGLEVDSMPHASVIELIDSIKGANWYTVLANTFVTRLGGEASLRHALSAHDDIEILTYNNGLIIRAGEYPELGALEDGPPAAYVAVNNVIKPIRITHPDQLHCASPYGTCFDQDSTHRWYARFDR
ncbi:DUF3396 domain-containing protein [Pseudomonas sp. SDO528_S397]